MSNLKICGIRVTYDGNLNGSSFPLPLSESALQIIKNRINNPDIKIIRIKKVKL